MKTKGEKMNTRLQIENLKLWIQISQWKLNQQLERLNLKEKPVLGKVTALFLVVALFGSCFVTVMISSPHCGWVWNPVKKAFILVCR